MKPLIAFIGAGSAISQLLGEWWEHWTLPWLAWDLSLFRTRLAITGGDYFWQTKSPQPKSVASIAVTI